MEYRDDDHWLFGQDSASNKTEGLSLALWLVGLIIVSVLFGCTDGIDAANIARDVEDVDMRSQEIVASWYSYTYAPIKASDANVTLTVCQNTDSTTNWHCYARKQ